MKTTKSILEYALAGSLTHKPRSGYDLRKTFTTTGMRYYSDSPGSIYPALRRLESRGWIAVVPETLLQDEPRKRQLFTLTGAGKQALVEWLSRPVTRDDVVLRSSELMLRFAFMDGNVPRSLTIRFLADFEREKAAQAAGERAKLDEMRTKVSLHTGVLAYESGILGMETQANWARRAREQLELAETNSPPAGN